MKIAIIGTRGIPNNYGGFEQFAEYLSVMMAEQGYDITVYNPHFHPFKEDTYKGVKIIRKWSPEDKLGSSANFIYDYLCLKDALNKGFDIIYEAGYATNVLSHKLLPIHRSKIVTNMDGLEWKRAKWNRFTRRFTKYLERLTVKTSHYLVADNIGIQKYLQDEYGKASFFLAYGANKVTSFPEELLQQYNVTPFSYYILIARLEPENNIEAIIDGYLLSGSKAPLLVVGNKSTKLYHQLQERIKDHTNVKFMGGIYDQTALNVLRKNALAYFHGHSVGGTNPSLLEAMASHAFIIAHNNEFNKSVLKENALFFNSAEEVKEHIGNIDHLRSEHSVNFINLNLNCIEDVYSWKRIVEQHIEVFEKIRTER